MTDQRRLQIALVVMRISIGLFFLVWAIEKLVAPEVTQRVFKAFYFSEIPIAVSYGIGILQTLIILVFLAGLFKTVSYGALLVMHLFSVLSTYEPLLNPYEPPNHLFWAGVPVLRALIALFLLRDQDQLLTVKK